MSEAKRVQVEMEKYYVWESNNLKYLRPTKEAVEKYKTKKALVESLTPEEWLKYKAMAYDVLVNNLKVFKVDSDECLEISLSVENLSEGSDEFEKF